MPQITHINLDIAIIGGGVAGLWLANRLKNAGYSLALFEHKALGSDQTIASQGMIHGGMKYTLSGVLNGSSESLADMPRYWRSCLCGEGDVDLRNTRILSDFFYFWSSDSVSAKLSSFLASKTTRGRVDPVSRERCPPLLRHTDFSGSLYRLEDVVLDVHSLVVNLAQHLDSACFLIDWTQARWQRDADNLSLIITQAGHEFYIHAQRFIFCAGKGNGALLEELGLKAPAMQLRPLQQVLVKHSHPYNFFGHCLGADTTPRLTISSHKLNNEEHVWYLGGSLAERGAQQSPTELINAAKAELAALLPWVNLRAAEWATLPIERAEPQQPGFIRPEQAFAEAAPELHNLLVAWPTKLTLAPNLANRVLDLLQRAGIQPSDKHNLDLMDLPHPPIAPTPWELAFPPAMSAEESLALRFTEPEEDA